MIELDLNRPAFQESLFTVEKSVALSVLGACKKLRKLTWEQLYQHNGFNWELIASQGYYTFRASSKIRVSAVRDGNIMRLLEIFEDHDSAYA